MQKYFRHELLLFMNKNSQYIHSNMRTEIIFTRILSKICTTSAEFVARIMKTKGELAAYPPSDKFYYTYITDVLLPLIFVFYL